MKVRNETTNRAVLGAILLCLRNLKQINQEQIASFAGVSAPTWSRIEKGDNPLTVEQLRKVSIALCVDASSILKLEEDIVKKLASAGILVNDQPPDTDRETNGKGKEDSAFICQKDVAQSFSTFAEKKLKSQFVVPVLGYTLIHFIVNSTSLESWYEGHLKV